MAKSIMTFEDDRRDQQRGTSITTKLATLDGLSRAQLTPDQQLKLITDGLNDAQALVRSTAIDAAIDLKIVGAVPHVARLLRDDEDATVRASAAEAIGELGESSAVPSLVAALVDRDAAVRTFAASSLGLLQEEASVPHLRTALENEMSPAVALNIRLALARLGDNAEFASIADQILACARFGLGLQAINAVRDFAERPERALLSKAAKPISTAFAAARSLLDVSDLSYLDETTSLLSRNAPSK
jgi:hypothetical protein